MWVVSVPVWGNYYIRRFINSCLPCHREALKRATIPVRYIVHTDQPTEIYEAMRGLDVDLRPVPGSDRRYVSMGDSHRDAIENAQDGDFVALFCGDIAPSVEVFEACEKRLRSYKAIVCAATRTEPKDYQHPPVASARDLLKWTMENAHPCIRDLFWDEGKGAYPWSVYFRNGENITLRAFHLHPLAIAKDGRDIVSKDSLDADLLNNFNLDEIHVVTSPDELALAEMTWGESVFGSMKRGLQIEDIAAWAFTRASPVHWWLSKHRIVIQGNGDTEDEEVWSRMMDWAATHPLMDFDPRELAA